MSLKQTEADVQQAECYSFIENWVDMAHPALEQGTEVISPLPTCLKLIELLRTEGLQHGSLAQAYRDTWEWYSDLGNDLRRACIYARLEYDLAVVLFGEDSPETEEIEEDMLDLEARFKDDEPWEL